MIVAPIGESFRLQNLGDARGAAQRFLSTTVAPEGSDKQARLLMASERYCSAASFCAIASGAHSSPAAAWVRSPAMLCRRDENGELYYTCEFTVQSPKFFRHNLSVYAVR